MGVKNRIWAGPGDYGNQKPLLVEGIAVSALQPGTICAQVAAGLNVSSAAATDALAEVLVVKEIGPHRDKTIADSWDVGDTAEAIRVRSGEFVNAVVASGNNILNKGVALTLNGAGKLAIATTGDAVHFRSEEVVNVTADALVLVVKA